MRQQHFLPKWLQNWHQPVVMRLLYFQYVSDSRASYIMSDGYVLVADNSTFPVWVAGWNVPWDGYIRVLCADRLQVPACISKSLLSAQCWWWWGSGCCVSDLGSSTPSFKAFMILCKAVLGYDWYTRLWFSVMAWVFLSIMLRLLS